MTLVQPLTSPEYYQYYVQIALGNGDGTFTLLPPQLIPSQTGPSYGPFAVGDFNGDGKVDLILHNLINPTPPATTVTESLWFFPGNGDGTFGTPTVAYQAAPYQVVPNSTDFRLCEVYMTVADFNGDGNLDLACENTLSNPDGVVSVLVGAGNGSFSLGSSVTVGTNPSAFTVADFNGDGKADLGILSGYFVSHLWRLHRTLYLTGKWGWDFCHLRRPFARFC